MASITIAQLKAFQAIMQTSSASEAARELHRTQPAITASIRALEEQLDLKLFTRSGNKLLPSAEARYLFKRANLILTALDETVESLVRFRSQLQGEIKVACMPSASQVLIPAVLAEFLRERPGVKLSFMTRTSETVQSWIASQQFDLGISETPEEMSDLYFNHDMGFPCLLAIHKDSSLAKLKKITFRDLATHDYIGLTPNHPITSGVRQSMESYGFDFNQTIELQTIIPAFTFIQANTGYGVVDILSAESYRLIDNSGSITFRALPFRLDYKLSILRPRFRDKSILSEILSEELICSLSKIKSMGQRYLESDLTRSYEEFSSDD